MVWPGARQCNDNRACLNYPMLLSLGGGSHIKRRSHYSPIGLVFWGDWAFPRGVHRSTMLRLPRFRLLGPSGHLRPDQYEHMLCAWTEAGSLELFFSFLRAILDTCCSGFPMLHHLTVAGSRIGCLGALAALIFLSANHQASTRFSWLFKFAHHFLSG
jgi:hypothetical protein